MVTPVQEQESSCIVRQSTQQNKHMEDLMTMPHTIKPTRFKPLRHSTHEEPCPNKIKHCHTQLVQERHVPLRVSPVDHKRMDSWHDPEEPHGGKEQSPETSVLGRGKWWSEECDDREDSHRGDGREVDKVPTRSALEDVVDWWEERSDDHGGDTGIVYAEEEDVKVMGVAAEEVANATRE